MTNGVTWKSWTSSGLGIFIGKGGASGYFSRGMRRKSKTKQDGEKSGPKCDTGKVHLNSPFYAPHTRHRNNRPSRSMETSGRQRSQ